MKGGVAERVGVVGLDGAIDMVVAASVKINNDVSAAIEEKKFFFY